MWMNNGIHGQQPPSLRRGRESCIRFGLVSVLEPRGGGKQVWLVCGNRVGKEKTGAASLLPFSEMRRQTLWRGRARKSMMTYECEGRRTKDFAVSSDVTLSRAGVKRVSRDWSSPDQA